MISMAEDSDLVMGLLIGVLVGIPIGWMIARAVQELSTGQKNVVFDRDTDGRIASIHYA